LKGIASVRLVDGTIHTAEVHWYEAHGRTERTQDKVFAGLAAKKRTKQEIFCGLYQQQE
jgi:hypothetical protein